MIDMKKLSAAIEKAENTISYLLNSSKGWHNDSGNHLIKMVTKWGFCVNVTDVYGKKTVGIGPSPQTYRHSVAYMLDFFA